MGQFGNAFQNVEQARSAQQSSMGQFGSAFQNVEQARSAQQDPR